MIFKIESGRVSKEMPGIGSGSGTRWALGMVRRKMEELIFRPFVGQI